MPDYGETAAAKETKAFKFIDAVELMNQAYEPDYLIEDLFERNTLGQFFGPSGHCKSFVIQDMGYCIAGGIDYHGLTTQQGNVAYVCGEGKEGIKRRLRALQIKYDADIAGRFFISEQPGAFINIGVTAEVAEAIKAIGNVSFVVVDTYHRNMGGGNENSADDFAQVLRNIDTFLKPLGLRWRLFITVATMRQTGVEAAARYGQQWTSSIWYRRMASM
jgi:RecA-family ATPase